MTQGIFRKLFPTSMILNKIWNFVNSGNDPGEFPETFSRYWKKSPEKPLSHDPFLGKNIFSWLSTHEIYLEIVSAKKSPESRPKIAKSGKSFPESPPVFLEIVSGICLYGLSKLYVTSHGNLRFFRNRKERRKKFNKSTECTLSFHKCATDQNPKLTESNYPDAISNCAQFVELSQITQSGQFKNLNSCADSWHERAKSVLNGDNGRNEHDSTEISLETPPEISGRNFWCNKNFSKIFFGSTFYRKWTGNENKLT